MVLALPSGWPDPAWYADGRPFYGDKGDPYTPDIIEFGPGGSDPLYSILPISTTPDPLGSYNGTNGVEAYPGVPAVLPAAIGPVIAALAPVLMRLVQTGALAAAVALAKKYLGRSWWKILLAAAAAGLIAFAIVRLLRTRGKKKSRRLSIGTNPRLGTLLKVAKRTDNLLLRFRRRVAKFEHRTRRAPAPHYVMSPQRRK